VRPSPATLIALLALFVALGGPAQARTLFTGKDIKAATLTGKHLKSSTLTGKHVKNRSLGVNDLSAAAVQSLTTNGPGSVGEAAIADGAVTGAKVADQSLGRADLGGDSVGPEQLTPNSVLGEEVEDGRLGARDVGSFAGTVTLDFGTINQGTCASHEVAVAALAPPADARDDAAVIMPPLGFPDQIVLTPTPAAANELRVRACNVGTGNIAVGSTTLRYVSFDF
jgi:hypothetical protein